MRSAWILSVLLLGLVGVAAVAAPTISVDNPVYTASVQSGSIASHTFRLTNSGDQTLSIKNVQTACGCMTTTLSKSDLLPGESIPLEARVNTAGFEGTAERTVTVQSNDPATPDLVLRLSLTIVNAAPGETSPSAPAPVRTPSPTPTPAPGASLPSSSAGAPTAVWPLVLGAILAVALVLLLVTALGG